MSFKQFTLVAILVSILSSQFLGCSGSDVTENDPELLYKEAETDIGNDRYSMALEKLRMCKNKFPYSSYATKSMLRIADVLFLQEAFLEAATAYETFKDLHPKHEQIDYAMYRIGESYYQDIPSTIARDMGSADKALGAFREYVERFPQKENHAKAEDQIMELRKLLAQKELYIGNYYLRRDFYMSAKSRYVKLLKLYPDTEPADQAREQLARAEEQIAKTKVDQEKNANGSLLWKIAN